MSTPSASASSTMTVSAPLPLTKLYTDGIPFLQGAAPSSCEIALWLRRLVRWSNLAGFAGYIEGPAPSVVEPSMTRDCLRYVCLCIKNEHLSGAIADQSFTINARSAVQYIKDKWLHGESESIILKRSLTTMTFSRSEGIQAFLATFNNYLSHIKPALSNEEAADILDTALSDDFDIHIASARLSPGLASIKDSSSGAVHQKNSFAAYTDTIAALAAKSEARRTNRILKHGAIRI